MCGYSWRFFLFLYWWYRLPSETILWGLCFPPAETVVRCLISVLGRVRGSFWMLAITTVNKHIFRLKRLFFPKKEISIPPSPHSHLKASPCSNQVQSWFGCLFPAPKIHVSFLKKPDQDLSLYFWGTSALTKAIFSEW